MYGSNKQPPSVTRFILNGQDFVIVSVLSEKHFLYDIGIDLGIRHTTSYFNISYGLYFQMKAVNC